MKYQLQVATLILSTYILVIFFQNCSKLQTGQELSESSNKMNPSILNPESNPQESDGNGQPYDGKIFVKNKNCADGTSVDSRIVMDSDLTAATFYRRDCATNNPESIEISQIRFDSQNSKKLFYKDEEFVMEKPAIPLPGLVAWYYQLTGLLQEVSPSIYIIDMYNYTTSEIANLKNSGHTVICSVSAGTVENWNPDANKFPSSAIGNQVQGGTGEKWLDTQNATVRSIMLARLDLARNKGCHGVDFDNVDGYANNTGFSLNKSTQLEYNQYLAFAAHDRNLILSLNNVPELAVEQANIFDFAIAEECFKYNECSAYQAFIERHKPVLAAEYGVVKAEQCLSAENQLISLAYFNLELDGSRYETCPIK